MTPASPEQQACVVVGAVAGATGATGLDYLTGISRESSGSRGLCLQLVRVPPGGRARAHYHEGHETAAYVLEGEVVTWYGPRLELHATAGPGDFLFIPAGVPHVPVNYGTVAAVAVIARTDPHAQESVVALPELDDLEHLAARPPPS
jgi:uncharacterized RmlC-like cupin family protein